MLQKIMDYDPEKRLLPEEVLNHRWLKSPTPAAVSEPAAALAGATACVDLGQGSGIDTLVSISLCVCVLCNRTMVVRFAAITFCAFFCAPS